MKDSKDFKSVLKSTSVFGGAQLIQALLGLFRSKIIAVLMGPAGLGIYALLTNTFSVATTFFSLGVNVSAVKSISQSAAQDKFEEVHRTINILKKIAWLSGLIGTLIICVFASSISQLIFSNSDYKWYVILVSLIVLLNLMYLANLSVLQGLRRTKEFVKSNIIGGFISFALSIPLYYYLSVKGIIFSALLVSFSLFISSWYFARSYYGNVRSEQLGKFGILSEGFSLVKIGLVISFSNLFSLAVMYAIRIIISKEGSIQEVGLYDAGYTIINSYVSMIFAAMASDFYPKLSAQVQFRDKLFSVVHDQIEIVLLLIAPLIVIFIVFRDELLRMLYSQEFLQVNNLSSLVAIGMLFKSLSWPLSYLFLASGRNKVYFFNEIFVNIIYLILTYIGYKYFDMIGVGVAFVVTFFIYSVQVLVMSYLSFEYILTRRLIMLFLLQFFIAVISILVVNLESNWVSKIMNIGLIILSVALTLFYFNQRISLKRLIKIRIN